MDAMKKILLIDDDKAIRLVLSAILKKYNYLPVEVPDGHKAIEIFDAELPAAVLLDIKMPEMDGIQVLQELKKINSDVPIVIVTGYADIPTAVQAIKLGAYDFLQKPPHVDKLILTLERAIENYELHKTLVDLDTTLDNSLEWIFGKSENMRKIIHQIRQIAQSDFSVIIQGETGTGKSIAAQTIHNLSKRAKGPFQSIDVGVISENLIESELFGHEKGSFTGADRKKIGFFEIANKGTLFIDELENMPLQLQSKLLRAVEEKRIYPVGSTKPVDIDVRIIAATNADIKQSVRDKMFREDLFFRLSEFIITVPRLKDRAEDIPFLAKKFFTKAAIDLNKQIREIDSGAMQLLQNYSWPGNIRELKNVIRRAVLLSDDGIIKSENIEFLIEETNATGHLLFLPLKEITARVTRDAEKQAIKQALVLTKGNKTKAAMLLEIDYKTLLTKIKEYDLHHKPT
jgi:DNA-binding NtrC family response regulator